jgi:hypothetical protein
MPDYHPMNIKDAITFERYRYILAQKALLNSASFRLLALYHVIGTSLIGAGVWLILNWKALGLLPSVTGSALYALLLLLAGASLFLVVSLIAGIVAWYQYGKEEASIISQATGESTTGPQMGNILRWYETYMIVYAVATVGACSAVLYYIVLPALK